MARDSFDFVVVGGGSSGVVVASRLTQATARVLLLEAGGTDRRVGVRVPAAIQRIYASANWRYMAEPDESRNGVVEPRSAGRILGGGGSVNSCVYVRGHRLDFDGWAKQGAAGWDYESVLPAFKRVESWERGEDEFRGGAGPISVVVQSIRGQANSTFLDATREAGYVRNADYNGAELEGAAFTQVNQRRGLRSQSSHEYLRRVATREHLTVRTGALAHRVLFEGGRAVGVEYSVDGRVQRAYAREEVLVAAGPFGTARLLMVSGVGPRDVLGEVGVDVVHESPGVGKNLHDHVYVIQPYLAKIRTLNKRTIGDAARGLSDLALHGTGVLTTSVVQAIAMHRTDPSLEAPDTQIGFTPFAIIREMTPEGVKIGPAKEPGFNAATMWLTPRARGEVRLRSSDPSQPPVIKHDLLGDRDDVRDLLRSMAEVRRIMEQPAMREITHGPFPANAQCRTDADWERYARATANAPSHPVGTCRMGVDDLAVVDPRLRVHGVAGLRVVDTSVMPTVTRGNTNAPAMMIGERAADFVLTHT